MEKINRKQEEIIEIDLLELCYVLLSKIHLLILATLLGASMMAFYSIAFVTPKFQSSTSIYVLNKQDESMVTYTDLQTGSQLTKDYAELVKSRAVMEKVITKCQLNDKYADMKGLTYQGLASMVSVANASDTRIITITVTDVNPARAQDIANAVREEASVRISEVMAIENINVVDYADMPMAQINSASTKRTMIGAMMGFVVAAAIVVITYLLDDCIKTPDDVEKYLGISILGTIPFEESYVNKKKK